MFFYGEGIMLNGDWTGIAHAVPSAFIGVYCIAVFVVGYMREALSIWQRVAMGGAGILLLYQGLSTDLVGVAILIGLWAAQRARTAET